MVFSNECRAPPWRQVLGDICYIEVTTCEEDHFFVTASTEGYYINKVNIFVSSCLLFVYPFVYYLFTLLFIIYLPFCLLFVYPFVGTEQKGW